MQNRQLIREQFGILEEQLEEMASLGQGAHGALIGKTVESDLLVRDALESLRDLSLLVHDQQLLKSVSSQDFLLRICSLMVRDAATLGVSVAISHYGEGRISMEMAEVVLASIVAAFRSSLKSQRTPNQATRVQQHLFATGSIYLEVRTTPGEIQFRIIDDGMGTERVTDGGRSFTKLREHIARCGGWFGYKSFSPCGGMIEFKVPLTHNRTESQILRHGDFEALVPSACVAETIAAGRLPPEGAEVFCLDEVEGLTSAKGPCAAYVRIGVADHQFWLGCDSVSAPVRARRVSGDAFVEEGCWMRSFGLFPDEGVLKALPLLDGPVLVGARSRGGGTA